MAGWIALNFIKNKQSALEHFKNVFNNAKTNYTKSNAAFWLGKSIKLVVIKKTHKNGLQPQTSLKMSFYGSQSVKNIESFSFTNKKIQIVKPTNVDHLLEVIKILQKANQEKRAYPFLKKFLNHVIQLKKKTSLWNLHLNFQTKILL